MLIRDRYKCHLTRLQQTQSSDVAHEQWSLLAENYLRAWSMLSDKDEDLDTIVNAFTYLDIDTNANTKQKYTRRGHMRKIKSEPAVKDAARGAINARSYTGAAQNKLASQCKALLLRLTRTLGITTDNANASEPT